MLLEIVLNPENRQERSLIYKSHFILDSIPKVSVQVFSIQQINSPQVKIHVRFFKIKMAFDTEVYGHIQRIPIFIYSILIENCPVIKGRALNIIRGIGNTTGKVPPDAKSPPVIG